MKRALPFILLAFLPLFITAQQRPILMEGIAVAPMLPQPSPMSALTTQIEPAASSVNYREEEVIIGITRFETQSIGSMGRRVAAFPDGKVSAGWLHGLDEAGGWPDRGTAYNQFDGTEWGPEPTSSLEAIRSGYPCFTNTPNGLEVVFSHKNTTADQWYLQTHTKMPDETDWTETELPSAVPHGSVWAKVATGGPDGNSIHAIAVTLSTGFDGEIYEGMDAHLLYHRSTDAGATWDMVDVIIPGLDSNFYNSIDGESYNIYANGETVVVGVFDSWGDVAIFKSIDNGVNWEKTIVNDFPLDKYDGSGYGPGDVPFDPALPDSISMFSADGSGSVLVDDNGKVHVFFGIIYVNAQGTDRFLNISVEGIAYWNEDFETDELEVIASAPDMDGDGVITVTGAYFPDLRYNNTGFTTRPTSSIDDDGNIYLVFTTLREDLVSYEELTYRHTFIIKSSDNGVNWSDPFDLINEDVTEFYNFIEGVYPSIPARIGDKIDLVYEQDFEPGLTPTGTTIAEQFIMHVDYDKETFEPNFSHQIEQVNGEVVLAPNPAQHGVSIQFELIEPADASFRIFDMLGKQVYFAQKDRLPVGNNTEWLNLNDFAHGLYFVQMEIGGAQVSRKLVLSAK